MVWSEEEEKWGYVELNTSLDKKFCIVSPEFLRNIVAFFAANCKPCTLAAAVFLLSIAFPLAADVRLPTKVEYLT